MTLQIRPKAGSGQPYDVAYSPARDIAHLYPNLVQLAENMLYDRRYAPLHDWLDSQGVGEEQLAVAVQKFCEVLNEAHKSPQETLEDVMDRTGFSDLPPAAQVALTYYIGTLMAGTFFQGLRDIVYRGDDTTPEVERLAAAGARMADYAARGPWGRWWVRMKHKWRLRKPWFTIGGKPA